MTRFIGVFSLKKGLSPLLDEGLFYFQHLEMF